MVARTSPSCVAIRVDAGTTIGSGHVMRCLALACELAMLGHDVHFICRARPGHLSTIIEAHGFDVHMLPLPGPAEPHEQWLGVEWQADARETSAVLGDLKPWCLIVDHYGIDAHWEREVLGETRALLVVIDDLANRPHSAQWLVDQNLQPAADRYRTLLPSTSRSLLGPRHAMLRPQFAQRRRPGESPSRARRLLASAGGNDATGLMAKVVRAWSALPAYDRPRLDVIAGSAISPSLRDAAAAHDDCHIHVQVDDVASLMLQADLMVIAGGSMNWERCCIGVPGIVCPTADNQISNAVQLARRRTAINLGPAEQLDEARLRRCMLELSSRPRLLASMRRRAMALVDGLGAKRVALAISSSKLVLRPSRTDDAPLAWQWRNAESTRARSVDARPIELATHCQWWERILLDPEHSLLVAEIGPVAVGILRLDHVADFSRVSIYLDPELTGLGIGGPMLSAARAWVGAQRPASRRLHATILQDNFASQKAFAAAGFRQEGQEWTLEL